MRGSPPTGGNRNVGWAIDQGLVVTGRAGQGAAAIIGRRDVIWQGDSVVRAGFVDLDGLAIEVWVGKVAGGAAKVDHREIDVFGVLVDEATATDDLHEYSHRADLPVELIGQQV